MAQGSAPGVRREWSPAPLESTDKATRTGGDGLERGLYFLPGEQAQKGWGPSTTWRQFRWLGGGGVSGEGDQEPGGFPGWLGRPHHPKSMTSRSQSSDTLPPGNSDAGSPDLPEEAFTCISSFPTYSDRQPALIHHLTAKNTAGAGPCPCP